MNHFHDRDGALWCEGVALAAIAQSVGTPAYVYSTATLERHYRVFAEAFTGLRALVAFSVKANPNLSVLATLAKLGAGADVVSEGELRRALAAGVPPARIVFSGVGKTDAELAAALETGVGLVNVESESELEALSRIAVALGRRAPVAIRLNPDVAAGGHDKIATGRAGDKFGVAWERAEAVYAQAAALPGVAVVGVDAHIGSQIAALGPFTAAAEKLAGLAARLRALGHAISRVDIGGGLAIPYREGEAPPDPAAYGAAIRAALGPLDVEVILEPGRLIAGNAGVLLARVIRLKEGAGRRFAILDAGMNDLLRPALYDAWHDIRPVRTPAPEEQRLAYDVAGPVCESSDMFGRGRLLPALAEGELVVLLSAGAYGASLASEYNSRPRVAEVLVAGEAFAVVRPRPSYEAMLATEPLAPWLPKTVCDMTQT